MNFVLGEIEVPLLANLEFSQTYESIGGYILHRMQSGRAVKQTHFNKLKTTLSGQGWIPIGLDAIDYSQPLLLKCAAPRCISSNSNRIAIPKSRRKDVGFEPKGYAIVDDNIIERKLNLKEDIAIVEKYDSAYSFQICYYPEIIVFAEPIQVQTNISNANFSWSLVCEEI